MKTKNYEIVKCECGHECPIEFSHLGEDGLYTCVDCVIEELKSELNKVNVMNIEKLIKKIDFADECNKEVAGNYGRTMTITMEEAWLFKQLLQKQVNGVDMSNEKALHKHGVTNWLLFLK